MGFWSEELRELDRNTVYYMIDQLQQEVDDKEAALADRDAVIADKNAVIADKDAEIARLKKIIEEKSTTY